MFFPMFKSAYMFIKNNMQQLGTVACSNQEARSWMITEAQGLGPILGSIVSLRNNKNIQTKSNTERQKRDLYNTCIAAGSLIDFILVLCSKVNYTETKEKLYKNGIGRKRNINV